jgi:hypothetical protein
VPAEEGLGLSGGGLGREEPAKRLERVFSEVRVLDPLAGVRLMARTLQAVGTSMKLISGEVEKILLLFSPGVAPDFASSPKTIRGDGLLRVQARRTCPRGDYKWRSARS